MATQNQMLKLLNSQKSGKFNDWESGFIYALTYGRYVGNKDKLQELCARCGFSPEEVMDEEEGIDIKAAA